MTNVSRLHAMVESGPVASDELLPLVYAELRKLAAARLASEPPGQTLQPTALVHEAYMRLIGPAGSDPQQWDHQGHFFAAAAEAMRRILVENARRKRRLRHGGARRKVELADPMAPMTAELLPELDEALTALAAEDPLAAKVVELRYFAGLGHESIAAALDITVYLARQKWSYARAWLRVALCDKS
jgi:RNA polymerase sigma factor (TIGR02999 family)